MYHSEKAEEYGIPKEQHYNYVMEQLQNELTQGFQSLEMKLNTVPCSRGDFAFTTLTFGLLEPDMHNEDNRLQFMIANTILNVRMNGQGKSKNLLCSLNLCISMKKRDISLMYAK